MSANPHANGGMLVRDPKMPDFRNYAVRVPQPSEVIAEATRAQGEFIRDVMRLNVEAHNFHISSPDEMASNRWGALFDVTNRFLRDKLLDHKAHIEKHGQDRPEIGEWKWKG